MLYLCLFQLPAALTPLAVKEKANLEAHRSPVDYKAIRQRFGPSEEPERGHCFQLPDGKMKGDR